MNRKTIVIVVIVSIGLAVNIWLGNRREQAEKQAQEAEVAAYRVRAEQAAQAELERLRAARIAAISSPSTNATLLKLEKAADEYAFRKKYSSGMMVKLSDRLMYFDGKFSVDDAYRVSFVSAVSEDQLASLRGTVITAICKLYLGMLIEFNECTLL